MKLIRFGPEGEEKPGMQLDSQTRIDLSSVIDDYDSDFFTNNGLEILEKINPSTASFSRVPTTARLGPPVAGPSKIICIGLNYATHAEESGMEIPKEPIVFFKSTTSICGPCDKLIIPKGSKKTDWEVELALVIGKKTQHVSESEAASHIAGYMLHNDYSERSFQFERGGQWVKGKSCDTFAPLGPLLVTRDEIEDIHNLNLWLKVNGVRVQSGNTSNLIFDVPHVVSYVSQFMTLLPGDIISTGTPPGVGMGMNPPRYLKPGDVIEYGIDNLGSAKQTAFAYK